MHRWLGRTYVVACAVGGVSGGLIAMFSSSGPVAGAGFLGLAISWLGATTLVTGPSAPVMWPGTAAG